MLTIASIVVCALIAYCFGMALLGAALENLTGLWVGVAVVIAVIVFGTLTA